MDTWWKRAITGPVTNALGKYKIQGRFVKGSILIGGCGRSGTSLLLSILSAHPKIYALPKETDAFTKWTRDATGQIVPRRMDRFYRHFLGKSVPKSCDRWCEKRPGNVNYIAQILEYFGNNAKFIHLVRDPRAVCTSYHPSKSGKYWIDIGRYWNDVGNGLKFYGHPQVFTVKYEDLVAHSGRTIQEICEFLNVGYGHEMKNWFGHAKVRKSKAWYGRLVNVHAAPVYKWQKSEHAERVKEVVGHSGIQEIAHKLGYTF